MLTIYPRGNWAPGARGAELSMRRAVTNMPGCVRKEISYINLHGTGTVQNDLTQGWAVARLFPGGVPCSLTQGAGGAYLGRRRGRLRPLFAVWRWGADDSVPPSAVLFFGRL